MCNVWIPGRGMGYGQLRVLFGRGAFLSAPIFCRATFGTALKALLLAEFVPDRPSTASAAVVYKIENEPGLKTINRELAFESCG